MLQKKSLHLPIQKSLIFVSNECISYTIVWDYLFLLKVFYETEYHSLNDLRFSAMFLWRLN